MTKKKIRILFYIIVLFLLGAVAISVYIFCFQYKEDIITETINNYLSARYNGVTAQNFSDSITKQTNFYSDNLLSKPTWVNNKDDIKAGKKYFEETGYTSNIVTSSTEKISPNKYSSKLYVLYINANSEDDNFVEYGFLFTVKKHGLKSYVFDNIEVTSNIVTYINGGEIHIHGNDVVLVTGGDSCDDTGESEIH